MARHATRAYALRGATPAARLPGRRRRRSICARGSRSARRRFVAAGAVVTRRRALAWLDVLMGVPGRVVARGAVRRHGPRRAQALTSRGHERAPERPRAIARPATCSAPGPRASRCGSSASAAARFGRAPLSDGAPGCASCACWPRCRRARTRRRRVHACSRAATRSPGWCSRDGAALIDGVIIALRRARRHVHARHGVRRRLRGRRTARSVGQASPKLVGAVARGAAVASRRAARAAPALSSARGRSSSLGAASARGDPRRPVPTCASGCRIRRRAIAARGPRSTTCSSALACSLQTRDVTALLAWSRTTCSSAPASATTNDDTMSPPRRRSTPLRGATPAARLPGRRRGGALPGRRGRRGGLRRRRRGRHARRPGARGRHGRARARGPRGRATRTCVERWR